MGGQGIGEDDYPIMAEAVRLVNLTPHEVVLRVLKRPGSPGEEPAAPQGSPGQEPPAEGERGEDGHAEGIARAVVRLPRSGRFARVHEPRLGKEPLNLDTGVQVELTRLRRSARITGLPKPEHGTRYVVSRLTALAARDRDDLVFPFDEERDEAGRITETSGLAAFRSRWGRLRAPAGWLRDVRAAARDRRSRHPLPREWLTGVLFAAATALLSGFLALVPGSVDNALAHGWAGHGQAVTSWSGLVCLLAGVAALGAGAWRWRTRAFILAERGTAYVIDESAGQWQHEEKESVLADIRAGFARTLLVPGPSALGASWRWQADADGPASRWDERVDDLVRAFWAVHHNDDQVTRNALFTWAPWPVAMAFAARAMAGHRGLVLNVRQRPSYGAAGPRQELRLTDPAHDFLRDRTPTRLEDASASHQVTSLHERLNLTIRPFGMNNKARPPASSTRKPPARRNGEGQAEPVPPLLLLVRVTGGPIGPIGMDLAAAREITVHASGNLLRATALPVLAADTHRVDVEEWRLTSAATPAPPLPWAAFPAVARQIAGWIIERAGEHPDAVVLLAARMPQELAVGLGIQLALRAGNWPQQVYPVHWAGPDVGLVVPRLRLGRDSVPAERPGPA